MKVEERSLIGEDLKTWDVFGLGEEDGERARLLDISSEYSLTQIMSFFDNHILEEELLLRSQTREARNTSMETLGLRSTLAVGTFGENASPK